MSLIMKIIDFVLHVNVYLNGIIQHYGAWTYGLLFFIIFMETGFVVTPFLPGDSLIFAAATFAHNSLTLGCFFSCWHLQPSLVTTSIIGSDMQSALKLTLVRSNG